MTMKTSFLNMFVKSPFKRLETHMDAVQACLVILPPFFEACCKEDWKTAEELYQQISDLESQADDLKRKIRLKMHHSLYLPVSRTELLVLLDIQDSIANIAEDIALLMFSRKISLPEDLSRHVGGLLEQSVSTAQKAKLVSNELSDLVETGFKGLTLRSTKRLINDLYALEDQSDQLQYQARSCLYAQEKQFEVLDVIFWYKCIDKIGDLADMSRRIGTQLLLLSTR
ncbi:TIGR00153 family protein [Gammaproteobacteria bacterium]|nr:TIGR00153 family protein [Gammaproteobacteria bacterium]